MLTAVNFLTIKFRAELLIHLIRIIVIRYVAFSQMATNVKKKIDIYSNKKLANAKR